jgi:hypothetical protein
MGGGEEMTGFECIDADAYRKGAGGSESDRQVCFFCDKQVVVEDEVWENVRSLDYPKHRYVVCDGCLKRHGDTSIQTATFWPIEVFTKVVEYWWESN